MHVSGVHTLPNLNPHQTHWIPPSVGAFCKSALVSLATMKLPASCIAGRVFNSTSRGSTSKSLPYLFFSKPWELCPQRCVRTIWASWTAVAATAALLSFVIIATTQWRHAGAGSTRAGVVADAEAAGPPRLGLPLHRMPSPGHLRVRHQGLFSFF